MNQQMKISPEQMAKLRVALEKRMMKNDDQEVVYVGQNRPGNILLLLLLFMYICYESFGQLVCYLVTICTFRWVFLPNSCSWQVIFFLIANVSYSLFCQASMYTLSLMRISQFS